MFLTHLAHVIAVIVVVVVPVVDILDVLVSQVFNQPFGCMLPMLSWFE